VTLERVQPGTIATAPPPGARALGVRVKPIIRLGMGVKVEGSRQDGSTFTRPSKTDYFTVRGDERAAAKFTQVYGDKPKAVKIMVPSSLGLALDISYRSFVGGQSEDGGRPLALGMTNFATLGYVGGPDVLRVWRQDGSYDEVETLGLDELGKPLDEIASDLGIEVHATLTFTVPDVLGWGSFAQVTSKGKKSADNLAFKLSQIYSAFGSKAPWAFDKDEPPLLVLKPDTALTRFTDKDTGESKWGKTKIFVLDIVIPEAFHDMADRLAEHQRSIGDPAAALYGSPRELEPARGDDTAPVGGDGEAPAVIDQQAEEADESLPEPPTASSVPGPDFEGEEPPGTVTPPAEGAPEFVATFTSGKFKGKTIVEIYSEGKDGISYVKWALKNWKTGPIVAELKAFAELHPEVR
jgi:hypothetical protein